MANLDLNGRLTLLGSLNLNTAMGGKVTIGGKEVLVQGQPELAGIGKVSTTSAQTRVLVNKHPVMAGGTLVSEKGLGQLLPSTNNTTRVETAGQAIQIVGDEALVLVQTPPPPRQERHPFTTSGQA